LPPTFDDPNWSFPPMTDCTWCTGTSVCTSPPPFPPPSNVSELESTGSGIEAAVEPPATQVANAGASPNTSEDVDNTSDGASNTSEAVADTSEDVDDTRDCVDTSARAGAGGGGVERSKAAEVMM